MFACCQKKEQIVEQDTKDTGMIIHLADKQESEKAD